MTPSLRTLSVLTAFLLTGDSAGEPSPQAVGTTRGRLVWDAGPIPVPRAAIGLPTSKDPFCQSKPILSRELVVDSGTKGVVDAVAYLVEPRGDYHATEAALLRATPELVVRAVGCEFVPFMTVVHKRQELTFRSSDPVGHGVFFAENGPGLFPGQSTLPPHGELPHGLPRAEHRPTRVCCDIHPWMQSYVMTVAHPLAAVTRPDGSFEIAGIPAGEQRLIVWQATRGYVTQGGKGGMLVTVPAGGVADVGEIGMKK